MESGLGPDQGLFSIDDQTSLADVAATAAQDFQCKIRSAQDWIADQMTAEVSHFQLFESLLAESSGQA
jgi:hypothetical protein